MLKNEKNKVHKQKIKINRNKDKQKNNLKKDYNRRNNQLLFVQFTVL